MPTRTVYFNAVNAPTINGAASARLLRDSPTGLTAGSVVNTFTPITNANYAKHPARGGTTVASSASTAPSGIGFVLDDESMTGNMIEYNSAGTSNAKVRLTMSGAVSAYLELRFYILRASGAYVNLGVLTDSASGTIRNTATYTLTGTLFRSAEFLTGDRLYVELDFYYTGNTAQSRTATWFHGDAVNASVTFDYISVASLRPVNDNWANAINLVGTGSQAATNNTYATYETDEPDVYPGATLRRERSDPNPTTGVCQYSGFYTDYRQPPGSLWWKWTCPTLVDGEPSKVDRFFFSTRGAKMVSYSNYLPTLVRVYKGSTLATLEQLQNLNMEIKDWEGAGDYSYPATCSQGLNFDESLWSNVELHNPVPGTTYYFKVETYGHPSSSESNAGLTPVQWRTTSRLEWIQDPVNRNFSKHCGGSAQYQDGYFDQNARAYGYWEMWQSFGSPDPYSQPDAHDCVSQHAMRGSVSAALVSNGPDQGGWTAAGYGWVTATNAPGQACAPLPQPHVSLPRNYPNGLPGGVGSGLRSGSSARNGPQGPSAGGTIEQTYDTSVLLLSPSGPALLDNYRKAKGDFRGNYIFPVAERETPPANTYGVIYEQGYADIVSMRVRPSDQLGAGISGLPAVKAEIVGEWRYAPTQVSAATSPPAYGFFMEPVLPGEGATGVHFMASSHGNAGSFPLVGTITFNSSSVRTGITTEWFNVPAAVGTPEYNVPGPPYSPGQVVNKQEKMILFQFIADHVRLMQNHGYGPQSANRFINAPGLEVEIVFQPPRYAYLYDGPRIPDACSYPTVEPRTLVGAAGPPRGGFE